MDVCEALLLDVVAFKVHHNGHSNVLELGGPTFDSITTQEFSMVDDYMEDLKKPQNCQNWGRLE